MNLLTTEKTKIRLSNPQIGHILQINLKKEHSEFKTIIGEVFLEKTPSAKTVVAKNDTLNVSVENKFRILPFEIIAGENSLDTTHVEHGNRFHLNLEETYWKRLNKTIFMKHYDIYYYNVF